MARAVWKSGSAGHKAWPKNSNKNSDESDKAGSVFIKKHLKCGDPSNRSVRLLDSVTRRSQASQFLPAKDNSRCEGDVGLKDRPSLQGRQRSVTNGCFQEAKLQRRLYGDELGEGKFASRPVVAGRAVRGSTAGIRAERSLEVGADGPLLGLT